MDARSTMPIMVRSRQNTRQGTLLALGAVIIVACFAVGEGIHARGALHGVAERLQIITASALHGGFGTDAVVAVVLLLAGIVSGLSGFAFSAVAACILWLLPPLQAMPLIMLLSLCNQIQLFSHARLRRQIVWRCTEGQDGAVPYIAGGLVGIPFGLAVLHALPASVFACGLGVFLVLYSGYMLLKPARLRINVSGWQPSAVVGFAGGIVGGFSGFPGSMPVVYLGLRGVGKNAMRGITLPYILVMQIAALGILAVTNAGIFDLRFLILWVVTLPSVLAGSAIGVALYRRMSDINFHRTVLVLLAVSGFILVVKALI
jgi:uncharacterized protein